MWVAFALVATILTSLLPICTKQQLRDTPPALVAWAVNAVSLPLPAVGIVMFTLYNMWASVSLSFSCMAHLPQFDLVFVAALVGAATLLSTYALEWADASLVTPLFTFNPAFTILVAWVVLRETPGLREGLGMALMLQGAYLLEAQEARIDLLAPARTLGRRPGIMLALLASALGDMTTALEKLAIEHVTPPSGQLVALVGTVLLVLLLTPLAVAARRHAERTASSGEKPGPMAEPTKGWGGLNKHPRVLLAASIIAGIAPLFGFSAIALGLVGSVTALFKLSAVFTLV
jgi:uncharacterized membrane protein